MDLFDVDSLSFNPMASFKALLAAPTYHLALEVALILWVIWLLFRKSYKPPPPELSEREKEQLIQEWIPEPLVPPVSPSHHSLNTPIVSSKLGKYVTINDKNCLNLGTHNYLGFVDENDLDQLAIDSLRKYGVGSCGPRGFYGTVDIHLELEDKLAQFMSVEEAVLYSYGFSSVASAIPAYAKQGDVIFCDAGVHFAIQKGLSASRSTIKFFRHNDVDDLERLLDQQAEDDKKNPKKAKVTRRFLVIEGLYMNHGDIAPLPELLALKRKHKVRLFVDETVSFGVLGATGRGLCQYYEIPVTEVDHISASLENAIAAYGGFCCGTTFIVDHQRLSGQGYCFSASLPPLQAAVALGALAKLDAHPELVSNLRNVCEQVHSKLITISNLEVTGLPLSPVKHLRFYTRSTDQGRENKRLQNVVDHALNNNVALVLSRYLEKEEAFLPEASIRLTINVRLTEEEIDHAVQVIQAAFASN